MVTVKRRLMGLALEAGVAALATPSFAQTSQNPLNARERAALATATSASKRSFMSTVKKRIDTTRTWHAWTKTASK
jgi:hypothetical protein